MKISLNLTGAAAALLALAACGGETESAADASTAGYEIVDSVAAEGGETLAAGTFSGRNNHTVSGGVSVVSAAGDTYLVLADDFERDDAPDPRLGFGNGEEIDKATMSSRVDHEAGALVYKLPASVDPSQYDAVILYCNQFRVPLAVAPLSN